MTAVYVNAGNDHNGNPKRGWLIIGPQGESVDFVEEGYVGRPALRRDYPDAVEASWTFTITPGEYMRLKGLS